MRSFAVVLSIAGAAYSPHLLAVGAGIKPPELKITVTQTPDPVRLGQVAEVSVALAPPAGITLNRHPGITLRIPKPPPGVSLQSSETFVGVRKPIENPAEFPFKTIDPLKLKATATAGASGERILEGTLSFVFCVKASGYCAPTQMKTRIPFKVAG